MATQLDVSDVGPNLVGLLDRVRHGEEITIAQAGQPVARLVPLASDMRKRAFGMFQGQVWMSEDFDAPLPEDELREWEK